MINTDKTNTTAKPRHILGGILIIIVTLTIMATDNFQFYLNHTGGIKEEELLYVLEWNYLCSNVKMKRITC